MNKSVDICNLFAQFDGDISRYKETFLQDTCKLSGISERTEGYNLNFSKKKINKDGLVIRYFYNFFVALLCLALVFLVVVSPLDFWQQTLFASVCIGAVVFLRRHVSRFIILAMIMLSVVASLRYMYWRITSSLGFENTIDMLLGYGLLAAEIYALLVLLLGFVQTAWPLQRKPYFLPLDIGLWPSVDVFIPTYNESLDIVRLTVLAAQNIDWPRDRLNIYVLDDGRRDEFRVFCKSAGVGYITRDNNKYAKAGNINNALKMTNSEYIVIFDADHIPVRSFLQLCMGWFFKDKNLALLQTPHFFFSPDPFERNLDTFREVPNEGELFYGLVQDGNDLWNAAFFCGSCTILKRGPLEEIGGIAVETVTEDAHTALKISRLGYNTAYLALPQAAGLATESLSGHISQRIRWARGMAQIFRIDNPLFGKGLTLGQRFCYLNAMLHFFYGLPRLIFITAPLAYLLLDAQIFHAEALMIVAYAAPHILTASVVNSTIQGRFRHSFWNEIYETVLAWYIMRPVLVAMIKPDLGKFNVTAKGGVIYRDYFDWGLACPYIIVLLLNVVGIVVGFFKLGFEQNAQIATLLINILWAIYNIIIIAAAVAVAAEARQVRSEPRVHAKLPAMITLSDGRVISCCTSDFSQNGLGILLPECIDLSRGELVNVSLLSDAFGSNFRAIVAFSQGQALGLSFQEMDIKQQRELVRLTFSRADAWITSWGKSAVDTPVRALRDVSHVGWRGVQLLFKASLAELVTQLRSLSVQVRSQERAAAKTECNT